MGSVGLTKLVLSTPHRIIASKRSLEQLQPPPNEEASSPFGVLPPGMSTSGVLVLWGARYSKEGIPPACLWTPVILWRVSLSSCSLGISSARKWHLCVYPDDKSHVLNIESTKRRGEVTLFPPYRGDHSIME